MQLLMLQKIGSFTCCIDRGVGANPGVERVAHSSISQGLLEVFVTAWCPLPPTTSETVLCTWGRLWNNGKQISYYHIMLGG